MINLTVHQVDAFTTKPFSGNPAAVITEADGLTDEMMQMIAKEMYLSETTFVTASETEDSSFRIRFYTPSEEIGMSGHAIIASCYALIVEGRILINEDITRVYMETNYGKLPVDIHFRKNPSPDITVGGTGPISGIAITGVNSGILEKIMILQKISRSRPSDIPVARIVNILGIDEREITEACLPLEIVSTGIETLMIPICKKETLINMNPDLIKLNLLNNQFGIESNHVFTLDTFSEDCITYSRNFIPSIGMWEDPASGTSSAGLGMYLLRHGTTTSGSMIMEQGNEIDSLAKILVEINDAEREAGSIWIGGLAVTSIMRSITIEQDEVTIA